MERKKRKKFSKEEIEALTPPEVRARDARAQRVYEEWLEFDRRRKLEEERAAGTQG